jgi:hypothetical protein
MPVFAAVLILTAYMMSFKMLPVKMRPSYAPQVIKKLLVSFGKKAP